MVKERLFIVIRVVDDGELPTPIVKGIHRSKPWASYWFERYGEQGVKGLRNRPKTGRTSHISFSGIHKDREKDT